MLGSSKKTFQSYVSIPLFLNHFSPIRDSLVASAITDSVTVNSMSPISTSTPSKALAKDLVTSLWKPSNFSTNSSHCAFYSNSFVCGYPSNFFFPVGSILTITPMDEKLCFTTVLFDRVGCIGRVFREEGPRVRVMEQ